MNKYLLKKQVLISVFLLVVQNLFPQAFIEQTGISLPNVYRSSVGWGDYDNDGDLDILLTGLVIGTPYRTSKIYRNDAGVFTDIIAGLPGVQFSSVAWGDCDNDGDLDILLTGNAGNANYISTIYRNDAGVFTDFIANLTGVFNGSVTWGDYDRDGDLDILLTGGARSGYISTIYQNNTTVPNTVPVTPANLQSSVSGPGIRLSWNKSNDTQTAQDGLSYYIYIGSAAGTVDKSSPMASLPGGQRKIVQKGVFQGNSWSRKNLPVGTYYWSVQVLNHSWSSLTLQLRFSKLNSTATPMERPLSLSIILSAQKFRNF